MLDWLSFQRIVDWFAQNTRRGIQVFQIMIGYPRGGESIIHYLTSGRVNRPLSGIVSFIKTPASFDCRRAHREALALFLYFMMLAATMHIAIVVVGRRQVITESDSRFWLSANSHGSEETQLFRVTLNTGRDLQIFALFVPLSIVIPIHTTVYRE
jgi:hypothetical protein